MNTESVEFFRLLHEIVDLDDKLSHASYALCEANLRGKVIGGEG